MDGSFLLVLAVAAAAASPLGGFLAVKQRPTRLLLSCSVGTAAGVLLATFAFEIIPKAIELAALALVALGFAAGLAAVYCLDLYVNRWHMAGAVASQRQGVDKVLKREPRRGTSAAVLAGGTSAEEIIEGITIGAGAGGMFYLTVTDLAPEAEARHYQQSAALAAATGFLAIMILSELS